MRDIKMKVFVMSHFVCHKFNSMPEISISWTQSIFIYLLDTAVQLIGIPMQSSSTSGWWCTWTSKCRGASIQHHGLLGVLLGDDVLGHLSVALWDGEHVPETKVLLKCNIKII